MGEEETSSRVKRQREIFEKALEIEDPGERPAFLEAECRGDPNLLAELETLLGAEQDAPEDFLEAKTISHSEVGAGVAGEAIGEMVGNYKLRERLGEGAFGVVYLAEQLKPVKRRVALKVIKPGMDTREVITRFEAERQALGLMDHPYVAKVFDAGSTSVGRPYFVMELVRGEPITDYCDKNRVPVKRRLELFMKVCSAVQHAHQKGIVHRDLKPSNILVGAQESKAIPKVIDFGVAKAMSQELTGETVFTEHGQLMGTLQYMSPEQADRGVGPDIDTRSDIYSLGVVLYELLTGKTPLDPKELRGAGFAEIERVIQEEEPSKPSTRISTMGPELERVAKVHGSDPRKLGKVIRGELDWIVMKALEKDRTRRYATANEFAMDIARFLRNEPVIASPPSTVYRLGKFVRRNRGPLAAVAAVFLALLGGVIVSSWQAGEARQANALAGERLVTVGKERDAAKKAKEVAEGERRRAERSLLMVDDAHEMATELAGDLLVALHGKLAKARQMVGADGQAAEFLGETLDEAKGIVDFYYEGAEVGDQEDSLHMRSVVLNSKGDLLRRLGDYPAAKDYYDLALDIRKDLRRRDPKNDLYLHNVAVSYENLGDLHFALAPRSEKRDDEYALALEYYRYSLELAEELSARPDAVAYWHHDVAVSHYKVGMALFLRDEKEAALDELLSGLSVAEEVAAMNPEYAKWQAHRGLFCLRVGEMYASAVKDDKARQYLRAGKSIFSELRERDSLTPEYAGWLAKIEELMEVTGGDSSE